MRKFLGFWAFLIPFISAYAESDPGSLVVEDFTVPQGGQGNLVVKMIFPENHDYVSYQFEVVLPEGLSLVDNGNGGANFTLPDNQPATVFNTTDFRVSNALLKVASNPSTVIDAYEGVLVTIPVVAAENLEIGTKLEGGKLTGIRFTHKATTTTEALTDVSFTAEIVKNVVTLDENSTTAPEAAKNVNVCVKRTINANEWSTICLPFAMSAEQVTAAFGEDVQLADFIGYETTEEGDEVTGITINFSDVTAIEANHPYIIKVSTAVTEFTADAVNVAPVEGPCVEYDNGLTGKKRKVLESFTGTYVADFDFYHDAEYYPLFLSGNKLYYATENSMHMKAFRAYFDFVDYLSEAEGAESRISMNFFVDDVTTGIADHRRETITDNRYYNLQGQQVDTPKKGLLIKGNKKVVVK